MTQQSKSDMAALLLRFIDHAQAHIPRSTPLNEWSARPRGRYLHHTQQTQGILQILKPGSLFQAASLDESSESERDVHIEMPPPPFPSYDIGQEPSHNIQRHNNVINFTLNLCRYTDHFYNFVTIATFVHASVPKTDCLSVCLSAYKLILMNFAIFWWTNWISVVNNKHNFADSLMLFPNCFSSFFTSALNCACQVAVTSWQFVPFT